MQVQKIESFRVFNASGYGDVGSVVEHIEKYGAWRLGFKGHEATASDTAYQHGFVSTPSLTGNIKLVLLACFVVPLTSPR